MKRIYAPLAAFCLALWAPGVPAAPPDAVPSDAPPGARPGVSSVAHPQGRVVSSEELRKMGIDPDTFESIPPHKLPYPAPALSFSTLDGKKIAPKDLAGKVVLLDFWATWCAPCVKALPEIEAIAKRHADRPFEVISISADLSEEPLRAFLAEHSSTAPQIWDAKRELSERFEVHGYPTYLLIDPEGRVVLFKNGWGTGFGASLGHAIEAELDKLAAASRRKS